MTLASSPQGGCSDDAGGDPECPGSFQIPLEVVRRTRLVPFRPGRKAHIHCFVGPGCGRGSITRKKILPFWPPSSPLSLHVSIRIQDVCSCICGSYCWSLYMRRECKASSTQHLLAATLMCHLLQSHISFTVAGGGLDEL